MTQLKPDEKMRTWLGTSAAIRLNDCRSMLFLHGFLTYGESEKVKKRIQQWIAFNLDRRDTE